LLAHLESCQDIYRPQKLQWIVTKISKLIIEEKEKLEKEIVDKKEKLEELKRHGEGENNGSKQEIENLEKEVHETEDKKNYLAENIHRGTLQDLEKKGIEWKKWVNTTSQVAGTATSIAALIVSATCKIM
jgi:predicted nuclease with TOPRIM domain